MLPLYSLNYKFSHSSLLLLIDYGDFGSQNKGCEAEMANEAQREDRSCLSVPSPAQSFSLHHSPLGHLHYGLTWSWKDQKKLYNLLFKAVQPLPPPSVTKGQTSLQDERNKVTVMAE